MFKTDYTKSIGFIVPNLGFSQSFVMLANQINMYHNSIIPNKYDICVFSENAAEEKFISANFAICDLFWAHTFRGHLISTNLNTTDKLIHMPSLSKTFYIWDLEWLRMSSFQYDMLASIYRNPLIRLVARSQEHAQLIENAWDCKVYSIIEDFNVDKFIQLTQSYK